MRKTSTLATDICGLYGASPYEPFASLLKSEEAVDAWECLLKFKNINRLHILTVIPEIMMKADINLVVPHLQDDQKGRSQELLNAVDLLMSCFDGLEFISPEDRLDYPNPINHFLEKLRKNILLMAKNTEDYFDDFPQSQKRKNRRLTFQKMLSVHLEKQFGQPLLEFSAKIGIVLYPEEEPADISAVVRARTRERKARRSQ